MPPVTPFTRDLGVTQGRIRPSGWTPPSGDYVFCFGSDVGGVFAELDAGDGLELLQDDVLQGGTTFLRPIVHLRPAATELPPGASWRFTVRGDGVDLVQLELDRVRTVTDLHLPTSHAAGPTYELSFELEVVGAGGPWELELPAVYLDAIALDSSAGPRLVNRLPCPGETGVPADTQIQFDLCDTTASGISSAFDVFVDGVQVVAAGVAAPGWGLSTASRDAGRTLRAVLTPPALFGSTAYVVVRVQASTNDARTLDSTYTFRVGDTAAPVVMGASSPDERLVRVEFDEAVKQVDPAAGDDALNPENWVVDLVDGPAAASPYRSGAGVWVSVTSVRSVTANVVALSVDIPLTFGATYRVSAVAVEDLFGNVVDAPNNAATFTAFEDPALGRRMRLRDRVPGDAISRDQTGDLHRLLWLWEEPLTLILRRVDGWTDLLDPDIAPESALDAMLAELGNPFDFALSVDDKRRLVRILSSIYASKGTAQGILDAVRFFLGLELTITYPCFRGLRLGRARIGSTFVLAGSKRDHYAYDIVSTQALTDEQRARITELAEYMQAANEHLRRIVEPAAPPPIFNHLVLGRSKLNTNWKLH